jgi:hypothetical protein
MKGHVRRFMVGAGGSVLFALPLSSVAARPRPWCSRSPFQNLPSRIHRLERTAVSATTKVNRQDFGVAWNKSLDSGGVVVGDDVEITLDVEMVVPPPAK